MEVLETIPSRLEARVTAAVAWVNKERGHQFEVTGLVDVETALGRRDDEAIQLGLVLCDGELCTREQVQIEPLESGFRFSFAEVAEREIPPLLDPPEGVRSKWLDSVLEKHEFVLLLFYRGLW
ncbi:MAG: hypothetical protein GKR90_12940 [Pseudomonadales bacterium]|nr:hypothetical protein [Pseudomonadales bacterium]